MTTSIFCKTWRRDREYLRYMLRSLRKFARGFDEIVVVIPLIDAPHFDFFDYCGARVIWTDEPDNGRGYLSQQNQKLHADEYTDSDFIFYIDSDCFVTEEMTPEMFIPNGKPICLIRHWADAGEAQRWKPIVEKFLGFEMMFEGMLCLPYVIDRRALPLLRNHAQHTHRMDIGSYIMSQPGNDFSEFNALSAFSQKYCPYMYDFRIADVGRDGFPRILTQKWSWDEAGVEPFREEYERRLSA